MGKKGKWFSNVKKAFRPDSKKSKHKLPQYQNDVISDPVLVETVTSSIPPVDVKVSEVIDEQNKNVYFPSADVPRVSSQSVSEVVHWAAPARLAGKSKENVAAIMIQTAFRGYLARRGLRALRGLVRLRSLMEGHIVKRQAVNTLKCIQTFCRVQSQIRERRIKMSEENLARQRQLLQKHAKELINLRNGDDWNDSTQSKEQVEANLLSKYEAAMRRERALAYSFSHQQTKKNNTRYTNPMSFMDPSNPTWGWSSVERWMSSGRPLEKPEKENNNNNNDDSSVKSMTNRNDNGIGEIIKTPSSTKPPRKNSFLSPPTPSRTFPSSRKSKNTSPSCPNDDVISMASRQTDKNRRHSFAGSLIRDDESLASSPTLPSYMVTTESARAKLKPESSVGVANEEIDDKASAKKRLSYSGSPAVPKPRRFSAPPKVENGGVHTEIAVTNGGGS